MAWALAQTAQSQRVASGTNVIAYASNIGANSLLIATVEFEDDTATITSITDSRGNTWTPVDTILRSGTAFGSIQIWWATNPTGGANTVTLTPSAAAPSTLGIHEYSGLDTTAPFDTSSKIADTAGLLTTATAPTITTAQAGELLFVLGSTVRTPSLAGSGYTQRLHDSFNIDDITGDQTAGAAGPYNATFTLNVAGRWMISLAAFKLAAGGGGAVLHGRTLLGAGA